MPHIKLPFVLFSMLYVASTTIASPLCIFSNNESSIIVTVTVSELVLSATITRQPPQDRACLQEIFLSAYIPTKDMSQAPAVNLAVDMRQPPTMHTVSYRQRLSRCSPLQPQSQRSKQQTLSICRELKKGLLRLWRRNKRMQSEHSSA